MNIINLFNFLRKRNLTFSIFIHGYLSDKNYFNHTLNNLSADSSYKFLDAGAITFRKYPEEKKNKLFYYTKFYNDHTIFENLMKNIRHEVYSTLETPEFITTNEFDFLTEKIKHHDFASKVKYLSFKGYHVFLRFETSDINNYNDFVLEQLSKAINLCKPKKFKVNLIGHSRGGLVGVKYAMEFPENVSKVLTIASPYNPNPIANGIISTPISKLMHLAKGALVDISGQSSWLDELWTKWNDKFFDKIDLSLIACSWNKKGDFIVDENSQLGLSTIMFKGVNRYLLNEGDPILAYHVNHSQNQKIAELIKKIISSPNLMSLDCNIHLVRTSEDIEMLFPPRTATIKQTKLSKLFNWFR